MYRLDLIKERKSHETTCLRKFYTNQKREAINIFNLFQMSQGSF